MFRDDQYTLDLAYFLATITCGSLWVIASPYFLIRWLWRGCWWQHYWECCNPDEDMMEVDETTVRFRCTKCGKEEGL